MTKDKLVSNVRNTDGDIIFQVSTGGVATEAMRVIGSTGALKLTKGLVQALRTVTAATTLLTTDNLVVVSPTSADTTVTLPVGLAGRTLTIKRNSATYEVYVAPGSGTIDGATSYHVATNYQAVTFVSDGTNWLVI